jgi:hypothetical protein
MKDKIKEKLETCYYESPSDFLYYYVLQGCGCGRGESIEKDVWKVFKAIKKGNAYDMLNNDKYKELIAQWLDSVGLLEHGSNIYGSWLSKDGEELYQILKKKPKGNDNNPARIAIGKL